MKLFSKQSKQATQPRRSAPVMFERLESREFFSIVSLGTHSVVNVTTSPSAVVYPSSPTLPNHPLFPGSAAFPGNPI